MTRLILTLAYFVLIAPILAAAALVQVLWPLVALAAFLYWFGWLG
jgi:hypothetical protein